MAMPGRLLNIADAVLRNPNLPESDRQLFDQLRIAIENNRHDPDLAKAVDQLSIAADQTLILHRMAPSIFLMRNASIRNAWNSVWAIIGNEFNCDDGLLSVPQLGDHVLRRIFWNGSSQAIMRSIAQTAITSSVNGEPTDLASNSTIQNRATSNASSRISDSAHDRYQQQAIFIANRLRIVMKRRNWKKEPELRSKFERILNELAPRRIGDDGKWLTVPDAKFMDLVHMIDETAMNNAVWTDGMATLKTLTKRMKDNGDLIAAVRERLGDDATWDDYAADLGDFISLLIDATALSIWNHVTTKGHVNKKVKHRMAFRTPMKAEAAKRRKI